MTYQTIPVGIAGPSYESRSRPLSSQVTRNFYSEINDEGKDQYTLMQFYGQTVIDLTEYGIDRGQCEMDLVQYRVAGTKLYKVTKAGAHTELGTISGTEYCIFANDGENLFIVHDSKVDYYNGSIVQAVTDPEIAGSKSVAFINNLFLFTKDKFTTVSDVGDGTSGSDLNIIGAESNPDRLVRDYVFKEDIYRAGIRTIEVWWNSGTGNPPIDRQSGLTMQIGVAAKHSMANTDNYLYFLGDDANIYKATAGNAENISSVAIANAIEGYDTIEDAIATTFKLQGKHFYMITFPSENKTWAVSEDLGKNGWFELSAGTSGGKYNCYTMLNIYNQTRLADSETGKLYKLDKDSSTLAGETMHRVRVTNTVDASLLGAAKGKSVQMSKVELIMERGVGLITGQGENPQIMIEASYDGGKSFEHKSWERFGRLGETQIRVEWYDLRVFQEMCVRLTVTDPVPVFIYSATIDLRLAGR